MPKALLTSTTLPKDLSLVALITMTASAGNDAAANNLREVFYLRFRHKVYSYCLQVAQKNFGHSPEWQDVCKDIVQETFIFAVYNLSAFEFGDDWSESKLSRSVLSWLGSIAEHKLFDHYNQERGSEEDVEAFRYDLRMKLQQARTADSSTLYIVEKEVLAEAMKKIKARDQDVLFTYLRYGCIKGAKQLPEEIMQALCERWPGLNANNARQIKARTLERLTALCKSQKTKKA